MSKSFLARFANKSGIDPDTAYVITTAPNRLYATDFQSSAGVVVIKGDNAVFLVDGRYFEAAKRAVTSMDVRRITGFSDDLKTILRKLGASSVCFEANITVAELKCYKDLLDSFRVEADEKLTQTLSDLRLKKQPYELERIKTAQHISEAAYDHILKFITPEKTEIDVALELEFFMRRHGAHSAAFEVIALAGTNGSVPHGVPGDKLLCCGEFLTLDFGAEYMGYRSDMTRTVAIGSADEYMREVYDVVLAAQQAAIGAMKANVAVCEIDKAARSLISDAGFGHCFIHSTGHGVGIEIHESPALGEKSKEFLCVGSVVTAEPGIYIEGQLGVRIEDILYISESGCENLTHADKKLTIIN